MVPSLVDVSVATVSVVASSVTAAGSLVAVEESAVVVVVSSSAIAAVVSHPNTRETNTDASFLFTADPLLDDCVSMDAPEPRTATACTGPALNLSPATHGNEHAMSGWSRNQSVTQTR